MVWNKGDVYDPFVGQWHDHHRRRARASAAATLWRSSPTPVVLDDGHLADHAGRRELFRVLRAIRVDVERLIRDLYLWQRPDRALLIKERRAHMYEMQAKAGRPLFNVVRCV